MQQLVSFIGSGNVAWHLAPALDNTDYKVAEVYSRNPKHAKALVERLYEAEVKHSLDFSDSPSSVFIIAVNDDAISQVAQEIVLPDDAVLAHTSGSQALSVLGYAGTDNIGVFYPLQTFSKNKKVDFAEIPFFIEAETDEAKKLLMKMAKALSRQVHDISSKQRQALHVAAVFASNFSNHMLHMAQEIMKAKKLDYNWLKPLITETINKSLSLGPEQAQTGPARRADIETLDKHLEFLSDDEQVAELYRLISQHILDKYQL
ncbi:MAG TPA: DUF2520 domain-containing protein [Cyclobacteriaceae bacterium]|nr:DUF2520 domain-containing protein [Cyclobacteriaceae bacterium]